MTNSDSPPPNNDRMQVVTGSNYLREQAFKTPSSPASSKTTDTPRLLWVCHAMALVGSLLSTYALALLRNLPVAISLIPPTVIILFGIVGVQVMKYQQQSKLRVTTKTKQQAQPQIADINYYKGFKGEERVENTLATIFDTNYTLYKNIHLPQRDDDIDAVLVGPTGVYALEIKNYSGNYQYDGTTWLYQQKNKSWADDGKNPLLQLIANRNRLYRHLKDSGVEALVKGRLVWVGSGHLKVAPQVRNIWFINHSNGAQWIKDDIGRNAPIDAQRLQDIHSELKKISQQSEPQTDSDKQKAPAT